jgi:hypothetical protein
MTTTYARATVGLRTLVTTEVETKFCVILPKKEGRRITDGSQPLEGFQRLPHPGV